MAKIIVDGKEYQVADGNNLLHACLSQGLNLPYFCWHPAMGSVGACRQCAVKQYQDEKDTRGRIVMACMTPAADGTRISLEDPQAKDFRAGIIELLMTNHPHDCPVCEEGGECHLQDMTEMSGHTFRRYDLGKRTHRNQYLGPFINHEMNRCIACYRCVRYYQDYAGGGDLQMFGAHHHVYFGRHCDGTLENPFSGNLVEVCPTGVFTDKTFSKHFTRKWDLQCAPSICQHCALGCNTSPAERYGTLKRISNRYHSLINGYFLCDRGRFGYDFVNSDQRINRPLRRGPQATDTENRAQPASTESAAEALVRVLSDPQTLAVGSPRASLENNFALRSAVGPQRFCAGFDPLEEQLVRSVADIYRRPQVRIAAPRKLENCNAVLVLGEDILNTAPILALSVRQAVRGRAQELAQQAGIPTWQDAAVQELAQQQKNPLIIITPAATEFDAIATVRARRAPADIARIGYALANRLNAEAPAVDDLGQEDRELVAEIVDLLESADKPAVISGTSLLNGAVIEAAANVAAALDNCPLHYCLAECNSLGLALMSAESTAIGSTEKDSGANGQTLDQALSQIEKGTVKRLLVMENNLYRRCHRERLERALDSLEEVIVLDHTWSETAAKADWILPVASFAETEGTVVNSEARAQRFFAIYPSQIQPSWAWINAARGAPWKTIDALIQACAAGAPLLAAITKAAPGADLRRPGDKIPRMSHRYSGRTAINASINVSEPMQAQDTFSALAFSMEGNAWQAPASMLPGSWSPGWNSNQSIHKFQQEVNGELIGGSSGVRLLSNDAEPGTGKPQSGKNSPPAQHWFSRVPPAYKADTETLLPVALYHIFGSEELSGLSAPISARLPINYVALNPVDAQQLHIDRGDGVSFSAAGNEYSLAVRLAPELPLGLVGLPVGIGGLTTAALETPLTLQKAFDWRPQPATDDANVFARDTGATL